MRKLAIVAMWATLTAQTTLVPHMTVLGVSPDLVLLFIVLWCGGKERWQGVMMGFSCGFLQDLASGGMAGIFAFSKSIAAFLTCSLPWNREEENVAVAGVILFFIGLVHHGFAFLLTAINSAAGFPVLFLRYGIPSVLYTAVLGMGVSGVIALRKWWARRRETTNR